MVDPRELAANATRSGAATFGGATSGSAYAPASFGSGPAGTVALALSGGAARGMAHIGVLKALEQWGAPPTLVAGTSYGAIIAALYALTGSALEIERIVRSQDVAEIWRQGFDFGLHEGAVIHGRRLTAWLDRKFFFGATFADARVPLAVACTDLGARQPVILDSGSIAQAVRASCALPGLFAPVIEEGRTLIDGGFLEPVPFTALAKAGTARHLGVYAGVDVRRTSVVRAIRRFNVSRSGRTFRRRAEATPMAGPLSRVVRGVSISLSSYSRVLRVPPGATLLRVEPGINWWDFHHSPQAIAAGERAMLALLEAEAVEAAT